jgi:hypothetical protein
MLILGLVACTRNKFVSEGLPAVTLPNDPVLFFAEKH